MNKLIILLLITMLIDIPLQAFAQDSTEVREQKYSVSISQKDLFIDFDFDTLDIAINSFTSDFKGYALKVAVQTQYFNIDNIIPGDFFNDCGWEFFNTKQIISDFSTDNDLQVWKIIGLSEIFADSISPSCFSTERKTSIAKILISRNIYAQQSDSIIPLFFLWEDCSDNTISGMTGNELYVSNKVFQYFENQPQFHKNKFPTTQGIPANCTKASALNAPVKGVEFLHGGILLKDRNFEDSVILNK